MTAQSGKTGDEVTISYTSCKVVGNGSFGVVFAAKMLGESSLRVRIGCVADVTAGKRDDGTEEPEAEIAIKKVLQDKRFKVGSPLWVTPAFTSRIENCRSCACFTSECGRVESLLLL